LQIPWRDLLEQAQRALDEGDIRQALQFCDQAALHPGKGRYEAAFLRSDILQSMGDMRGALSSLESIADPSKPDARVDCGRGQALFQLALFAEAENALKSALRVDPELAEAWFTLGVMAEILGTGQEAEYFRTARKLDPDAFFVPVYHSYEEFQELVQQAANDLAPEVREGLRGVQTIVMDLPHPEDLLAVDPPISPTTFGMLVGIVPADEVSNKPVAQRQRPAILLFKRNLERMCRSKDELLQQLQRTLTVETSE
jgi:tetratricopeptide (TPR) repeat protein